VFTVRYGQDCRTLIKQLKASKAKDYNILDCDIVLFGTDILLVQMYRLFGAAVFSTSTILMIEEAHSIESFEVLPRLRSD
jgi:hypothetical protein